jgi:hypothetical protein
MKANVFGIAVHMDFGQRVKGLDLPGIGEKDIEHSWSLGDFRHYGAEGSIRTDIILRDRLTGRPIAIYDVKTGNATISAKRAAELRAAVNDDNVPIIELRLRDLTAFPR